MPKRLCAAIVLGALCAAGPTLVQQAKAMSETEAQQAAATAARAFQDAYNAGKPAAIAALYVQGGVVLTGAGTMLTDHQEIEKAYGGRIKAGWTNETIRVIKAHPEGDDVLFIVDYEITGTGANAGKQIGGYAANLLTHQGSGWRFKLTAANFRPVKDVSGMTAPTAK